METSDEEPRPTAHATISGKPVVLGHSLVSANLPGCEQARGEEGAVAHGGRNEMVQRVHTRGREMKGNDSHPSQGVIHQGYEEAYTMPCE